MHSPYLELELECFYDACGLGMIIVGDNGSVGEWMMHLKHCFAFKGNACHSI